MSNLFQRCRRMLGFIIAKSGFVNLIAILKTGTFIYLEFFFKLFQMICFRAVLFWISLIDSRYTDPALKFWFQEKLGYTNSCLLLKMSIIDFFFENLFFFHKTERFRFLFYLRPPKNQSVKRKRQSQKRMRKRNINTSFKT